MGKRVVILDADFGLANIEIMLGIRPKYNLADMMFHGKEFVTSLRQARKILDLFQGIRYSGDD